MSNYKNRPQGIVPVLPFDTANETSGSRLVPITFAHKTVLLLEAILVIGPASTVNVDFKMRLKKALQNGSMEVVGSPMDIVAAQHVARKTYKIVCPKMTRLNEGEMLYLEIYDMPTDMSFDIIMADAVASVDVEVKGS
jgi:hypothetical protein